MTKKASLLVVCLLVVCASTARAVPRGEVRSAETKGGTLGPSNNSDTWRFSVGPGNKGVLINVAWVGSSEWDMTLRLFRPDGVEVPPAVSGWPVFDWEPPLDMQRALVYPLGDNRWTIRISSPIDEWGYDVDYWMSLLLVPGETVDADSADGRLDMDGGCLASAQTIPYAGSPFSLYPWGDIDACCFWADPGQRIILALGAFGGEDLLGMRFRLRDPDAVLVPGTDVYGGRVEALPTKSGVYTVEVTRDLGDWSASLMLAPGPTSSFSDLDGGDQVISGHPYFGWIYPDVDTDAWNFYGVAGQTVTIAMTNGTYFCPAFDLYRPDGTRKGGDAGEPDWSDPAYWSGSLDQTGLWTVVTRSEGDLYGLWPRTGAYDLTVTSAQSVTTPLRDPVPANESEASPVSLNWSGPADATYDVYFGQDVCDRLYLIGEDLPSPSVPLPTWAQVGRISYWRVVAHRPEGDIQGPYWWFRNVLRCEMAINNGNSWTPARRVTLQVKARGASWVRFRNLPDGQWSSWQPYPPGADYANYPWDLAEGPDGHRGVKCWVKTQDGAYSAGCQDWIWLDTAKVPVITSLTINNGAEWSRSRWVRVNMSVDCAVEVHLKNRYTDPWSEWIPLTKCDSGEFWWELASGGDGPRAVYVEARDHHGGVSKTRVAQICLDSLAPPIIKSFAINGGADATTSPDVLLHIRIDCAQYVRFKNRYADPWAPWLPLSRCDYSSELPWTLLPGSGTRVVYVQSIDHNGVLSATKYDRIELQLPGG